MHLHRPAAVLSTVITAAATLLVAPAPTASAACPDVELIFARGRNEAPGAGAIGNALAGALRQKTDRDISLYAVRYPANTEVDLGANDMSQRVQNTMANCPDTDIVLGGYSLGAAVADVVLAVPISFFTFRRPLPSGAENHISAVALFGNGMQWVGPITTFSPVYRERTIELCHRDDPICNPTDPENWEAYWPDHLAPAYISGGMVNQAADFVAGRI